MFLSYDKAYRWPVHFAMLLPLLLLVLLTGSIYSFWGVEVRVPMAMPRLAYPGITAPMDFFTDWGD